MSIEEATQQQENQSQEEFGGFDLTSMAEMSEFIESKQQQETIDAQGSAQEETEQGNEIPDTFEPEESQEQEENEDPSSQDTPESGSSSQLYTAIAKLFMEDGLLSPAEGEEFEVKDAGGFTELMKNQFQQQVQDYINSYKESLDPRVRHLQEAIEQGLPFETALQFNKDNLTYSSITEDALSEDTNLQKQIVRDYYKRSTRFSDERIEKEIARLDDLAELDVEAKSSLTELQSLVKDEEQQAIAKAKAEQQAAYDAQQKALTDFQKSLEVTKEIIPGIPMNNIMRDKVWKTMTTQVAQDAYGNPINKIGQHRAQNPLDFEFKLAYFYDFTNGFTDFSGFQAPAKKATAKEIEKAAQAMDLQKQYNISRPNQRINKQTTKDILDSMNF